VDAVTEQPTLDSDVSNEVLVQDGTLVCPFCASTQIYEQADGTQLNPVSEIEQDDDGLVVMWSVHDDADFQHTRYLCLSCQRDVTLPDDAEEEWL
jgi:hypothetical protein